MNQTAKDNELKVASSPIENGTPHRVSVSIGEYGPFLGSGPTKKSAGEQALLYIEK